MKMVTEFIRDKKLGKAHSPEDIEHFIRAYSHDQIPDYQVSAWLMAVCLNGMNSDEAVALTRAMVQSGQSLTWNLEGGIKPVDKHSTGGIGDKTSLIIAPLVASFGIPVPMMAGRGLGFTGGTLDKMESIPGFKTRLSSEHMEKQMEEIGFFLVGQTEEICPADKRMYSLRDVTATVESLPLICASILSKKIAEGAQALVMDVKVGSGAFMSTEKTAHDLAQALIDMGKLGGLEVRALVTDMNQPLGRYVGNALEVFECIQILKGETPKDGAKSYEDTKLLSIELAAQMLYLAGVKKDLELARAACLEKLLDGTAYLYFEKFVKAQGGRLEEFSLGNPTMVEVNSDQDGYMYFESAKHVGLATVLLGGGRLQHTDVVNPYVGIEVLKSHADKVKKGDVLFKMYFDDPDKAQEAAAELKHSYRITQTQPNLFPLIHEALT